LLTNNSVIIREIIVFAELFVSKIKNEHHTANIQPTAPAVLVFNYYIMMS
jgi:hypothetical protein